MPASSSKIGSMKTVVGVGYYLKTLGSRVVNIVCDRQLRPTRQASSHSTLEKATKKPRRATPSHWKSHREPLLKNKSDPLSAFSGQDLGNTGRTPRVAHDFENTRTCTTQLPLPLSLKCLDLHQISIFLNKFLFGAVSV